MAINVSPSLSRPTHHIKLSRDGVEIGLILCDPYGKASEKQIQRGSYPKSALRLASGEPKHSDAEPPFRSIQQEDWSAGRGSKTFEDDSTRYADGWQVDPTYPERLILGPQRQHSYGYRSGDSYDLPGSISFKSMLEGSLYFARRFMASSNYNSDYAEIYLRKIGNPGSFLLELYNDNAGAIGTKLKTISTASQAFESTIGKRTRHNWTGTQALTSDSYYWLVMRGGITDDLENHYEIGCNNNANGATSSDGITWNNQNFAPYYRVADTDLLFTPRFFEYKRGLYMVRDYDAGGNTYIYLSGDRGTADANTGQLDILIDATQTWWKVDQFKDCIVLLTAGPGSEEPQPWRKITGNTDTGELTVSPSWNIEHTTQTEYVILGANNWKFVYSAANRITDIAVTDDYVYFARGNDNFIFKFRGYTNNGAWTNEFTSEEVKARYLLSTRHPTLGSVVWGGVNEHPDYQTCVFKGIVPKAPGKLYSSLGVVAKTDNPWDVYKITGVTQSIENGATKIYAPIGNVSGIIAYEDLPEPVDITRGAALGFRIKSNLDLAEGDLQLVYDDVPGLGKYFSPTELLHFSGSTYTAKPKAKDGDQNTEETLTFAVNDYLYIAHSEPFNNVYVYLGTTKNSVASVLYAQYFDGNNWSSQVITDGTASGGATFAKSGEISMDGGAPQGWEPCTINNINAYWLRFKVQNTLTSNINLKEIMVKRQHNVAVDLPALSANKPAWVSLKISPLQYPYPNETKIQSVGLKFNLTSSGITLWLHDDIQLLSDNVEYIKLPAEAKITGMEVYAGSTDDPTENPWVFTETSVYEIQSQNNNLPIPLSLRELKEMRSEGNGKTHTVNGVYLWFNVGNKIERYYNRQLDDMGPDLDEGLPADRRGTPSKLLSYPGRIYLALDGGTDNYSSVLVNNSLGWHEVYRSHMKGLRIRNLFAQVIPGAENTDRLWMGEGSDVSWLPLALNPLNENYFYEHEGYITSSRIHGGLQDVIKYWDTLKLATENLWGYYPAVKVKADYRKAGDTTWTELADDFDTSPYQEIEFSSAHNVDTRWIDLRVRLLTEDNTKTPIILGWVVESIMRQPVKPTFTLTFRLADSDVDLNGDSDPGDFQAKLDQLDAWINSARPLLLNSISTLEDGAIVFPEPAGVKRLRQIIDPDTKRETLICQMTLIKIR